MVIYEIAIPYHSFFFAYAIHHNCYVKIFIIPHNSYSLDMKHLGATAKIKLYTTSIHPAQQSIK